MLSDSASVRIFRGSFGLFFEKERKDAVLEDISSERK